MKFTHFMADPSSASSVKPIPAKNLIPQWYKDAEKTYTLDNKEAPGIKSCVPVLDALVSGYLVLTSGDIYVKKDEDNKIFIEFGDGYLENYETPIGERPDQLGYTIPRPAGHLRNHLVWTSNWGWKTPRGYSMLVTHPLNGWHLPFTTMSAIVDSDKFHGPGNIPFFLKEGFEGMIPKGTPYMQLLPIKRKKWKAIFNPSLVELALESGYLNKGGIYKNNVWQKKIYLTEEENERK